MDRAWCATAQGARSGLVWISEDPHEAQAAAAACRARCPVLQECLAWVLDVEGRAPSSARGAVFGALGPVERAEASMAVRLEDAS